MIMSDDLITPEKFVLFDTLAELALDPDKRFADIRALYAKDESVRVPAQVFNVERRRTEAAV
jgi:hypothetical protein